MDEAAGFYGRYSLVIFCREFSGDEIADTESDRERRLMKMMMMMCGWVDV